MLTALPSGAEAIPYFDKEWGVVYKLFDLRVNGSLGKKIELVRPAENAQALRENRPAVKRQRFEDADDDSL